LSFSKRLAHHRFDIAAIDSADRTQRRGILFLNRSRRFMRPPAQVIWQSPGQQFIEDHTQRVDIATRIQLQRIRQYLLGTHVRQRPHELAQIGLAGRLPIAVGHPRHTKIQNLRLAGLIYQDVARLEIAVNQAPLMRMLHGFADLDHQLQPLPGTQTMLFGIVPQGAPVDELHGEVRLRPEAGIRRARLMDLRDAGVLQAGESL
jgi:hypothetical protein